MVEFADVDADGNRWKAIPAGPSYSVRVDHEGRVFRQVGDAPEEDVTDTAEGVGFLAVFPNWALDAAAIPRDSERQRQVDTKREELEARFMEAVGRGEGLAT